jgi:hypothetical protein
VLNQGQKEVVKRILYAKKYVYKGKIKLSAKRTAEVILFATFILRP